MTSSNLPATNLDEFKPVETLAKAFGVSKQTVYRWRDELRLPVIRLGSRTYIREASVAAWLSGLEKTVEPEHDSN
jgi:excisionase family DNA binding protein